MMNAEYQGKGIGTNIIENVCAGLKKTGFQRIRLAVDKGNPQSNHFWIKNCFYVTAENKYIVMEREL